MTFSPTAGSLGAIPDATTATCGTYTGAGAGAPRDVTFSVTNQTTPVTDVRLGFTLTPAHDWLGDLRVQLIAPSNAVTKTIFSQTGATTSTGTGDSSDAAGPYVFSDTAPAAPTWWGAAAAAGAAVVVPAGSYRASTAGGAPGTGVNTTITPAFAGLSSFLVNGTWTLRFIDGCQGNTGTVSAATLGINGVAAPQLVTDPVSPANNNAPNLKGTAQSDSTTNVYSTSNCTGAPIATLNAAQMAATGVPLAVADNSSVTVSAQGTDPLGAISPCSALTYVEDSVAPAAPTLTGTDPASPAASATPRVKGTSEAGTTVKIYPSGDCTGAPLAAGPDSQLAGSGLQITVGPGTTTQLSATAIDPAGLSSGCSNAISYAQGSAADKEPPETSFKKTAKKKSGDRTPTFKALSSEAGSTFQCRADKDAFKACKAKTTFDLKAGKHTVEFAAVDLAGNIDPTPAKFKFKIEG